MADVTIFGAGNMGTAIDSVLSTGGATVDHIRSDDPPGPISGEIVILAVPHTAVQDILDKYADQLAGKTIADITNPLNLETFDSLVVPAGSLGKRPSSPLRCRPPRSSRRSTPRSRRRSALKLWVRTRPPFWSPVMTPTPKRRSFRQSRRAALTQSTPVR